MKSASLALLASILLTGTSAHAQTINLLDGLLGNGNDNSAVTVQSGPASQDGVVNAGVGGGDGNILDLNLGNSQPLAAASAQSSGSDSGDPALLIELGAGNRSDLARTGVALGVGDDPLDADIDLLDGSRRGAGLGIDINSQIASFGGGGGGDGVGGNGAGGTGVGGTGVGTGAGLGGGVLLGNATGNDGATPCVGPSAIDVQRLVLATRVDASWQRAANVAVRPVSLCPDVRAWLVAELRGTGLGAALQSAVQSDALLSASLSRSSYGADRVFAVHNTGGQLTVFVY